MSNDDGFWYPTKEDVIEIHDDIIEDDPEAEAGIEDPGRIGYVVDFIEHGHFGEKPETIHEKAFDLMRLLAANHWFVDGNKRTALNTTELFYFFNGYEFEYGEDIRSMLKLFSVRENLICREVGIAYLGEQTSRQQIDIVDSLEVLQSVIEETDFTEIFDPLTWTTDVSENLIKSMEVIADFTSDEGRDRRSDTDRKNDHND